MLARLINRLSFLLDARNGAVLGIINILIVLGILVAGLWPFNFHPKNQVEWLQDGNGIRFYGHGMVISRDPFVPHQKVLKSNSITIEFLIRPEKESANGVSSILTLYDRNTERVVFGQWKTHLIIRIPATKTQSQKRYREIGVANILQKDVTHLITVASGTENTNIYVDRRLVKSAPHYSLIAADETLSGYLILGNSPEGSQSWNGTISGLAIYDRDLSSREIVENYSAGSTPGQRLSSKRGKPVALYRFDERSGDVILDHSGNRNQLLFSATFQPLRRVILGVPGRYQWFARNNLVDVSVNVFGFTPFGFLLAAWLRQEKNLSTWRTVLISILFGFCLSLSIELAQSYLPTRDSSLLDLASNALGDALGVWLFASTRPRLTSRRRAQ